MESLKSKLFNYLPKDKFLDCLGFLWPVINYSGETNTKTSYVWNIWVLFAKHVWSKLSGLPLSYIEELGNFHPIFSSCRGLIGLWLIKTDACLWERYTFILLKFEMIACLWNWHWDQRMFITSMFLTWKWFWKIFSEFYVQFYSVAYLNPNQGDLVLLRPKGPALQSRLVL